MTRSGLLKLTELLGKAAKLRQVRCSSHTIRHTLAGEFVRRWQHLQPPDHAGTLNAYDDHALCASGSDGYREIA